MLLMFNVLLDSSRYIQSENSNLVEENHEGDVYRCPIKDMPDPLELYPGIFKGTHLEETWKDFFISIPNVRDGDGQLIMPYEYRSKLKDKSIVMLNIQLKLCVSLVLEI